MENQLWAASLFTFKWIEILVVFLFSVYHNSLNAAVLTPFIAYSRFPFRNEICIREACKMPYWHFHLTINRIDLWWNTFNQSSTWHASDTQRNPLGIRSNARTNWRSKPKFIKRLLLIASLFLFLTISPLCIWSLATRVHITLVAY